MKSNRNKQIQFVCAFWLLLCLIHLSAAKAKADEYGDFSYYTNNDSTVTIDGYTGSDVNVVIPDTILNLPVTIIGNDAFDSSFITSVILPNSLMTIEDYVFFQSSLTNVTFGTNLTSIGNVAFYFCSLTNITLPNSLTNIGDSAFYGCSLGSVTIPTGLTSIGTNAFYFSRLTSVTFPNTVTSIGGAAFQSCRLTNVVLPDSLTNLGISAFSYCQNLTNVTIGTNLTSIGNFAFSYCQNLTAMTVDTNNPAYCSVAGVLLNKSQSVLIQYPIGISAQSYHVPDNVISIGSGAFSDSVNLTNVTFGTNLASIGDSAFYFCNLTGITLPNSLTNIGNYAFYCCTNLTSVTFPDCLVSLGDFAFAGSYPYAICSLTNVTIPASVTYLGDRVFDYCNKLTGIFFKGNRPAVTNPPNYIIDSFGDAWPVDISMHTPAIVYYLPGATNWGSILYSRPTALWNPQAQTGNANFGIHTNRFGFNITGTANIPIVVETSTNLGGTWTPLQSVNLTNGSWYFSDAQWSNYPSRFYRIRSP